MFNLKKFNNLIYKFNPKLIFNELRLINIDKTLNAVISTILLSLEK